MSWISDLLWELGRFAAKFSRKRPPGNEDHYYPAHPDLLGLKEGQCYHCKRTFARPYPVRGCDSSKNVGPELP